MKTLYNYIAIILFLLSYSSVAAQEGQQGTNTNSDYESKRSEDLQQSINSESNFNDEDSFILKGGPADANFINYQAVARDAGGDLMTTTAVAIEFIIHSGSTSGPVVFSEMQNLTTDINGVFSAQIGSITTISVAWNESSYFLEVKLDGTSVGSTQLVSVPYAMSAATMPSSALIGDSATNDASVLTISGRLSGISEIVDIRATNVMNGGNDILNLEMPTGSSPDAQYIEAGLGGNVQFRVDGDGRTYIRKTTTAPQLNTVYGNSMPIAYGSVGLFAGGTIETGYGITSITSPAIGEYNITIDHATNSDNCVVVLTPYTGAFGSPEIMGYEPTGANTFTVRIQTTAGVATSSAFTFVVYGNH